MVEMIVEVEIKVEDVPTYFPSCNFLFLVTSSTKTPVRK